MRCHYVPQFFLKNFATVDDPNSVFAYQRDKEPFKTTANSVAAKNDMYVFSEKATGGKKNAELEGLFAELEGVAKPIIERIIKTARLSLSDQEFGTLCEFFGFLHTRNLAHRELLKNMITTFQKTELKIMAQDPEHLKEVLKRATNKIDADDPAAVERLRDSILNFDQHFKVGYGKENDDYFLKQAVLIGNELIDILFKKKWNLLLAKEGLFFVTSDNPIVLLPPPARPPFYGVGFTNGIVAIPISPHHCLFLTDDEEPSFTAPASDKGMVAINDHILFYAHQFVYAHEKSDDIKKRFQMTKAGAGQTIIVS